MKSKVLSIINNKGGAAKTASATVLSELLASLGKRILLIDLDEQSNLSMQFDRHIDKNNLIDDLLKERYTTEEQVRMCIEKTEIDGIEIIPSFKERKNTVTFITSDQTKNNNVILKKALLPIREDYDFIIIDTAPANNVLINNAIFASDYIISPVKAESDSYEGLDTTIRNIQRIIDEFDLYNIEFLGAYLTVCNPRTKNFQQWHDKYKREIGNKFFDTFIRIDSKIEETKTLRVPLIVHDPRSRALHDYANLLLEMNILDDEAKENLEAAIN